MAGANVIRVPLGNDQAFLDRIEQMIDGLYPTPKLLILNYPAQPDGDDDRAAVLGTRDRDVPPARRDDHQRLRLRRNQLRRLQGPELPGRRRRQGHRRRVHDDVQELQHGRLARAASAAGNAEMVKALATIKGYYDYGISPRSRSPASSPCASAATSPRSRAKIYAASAATSSAAASTASAGPTKSRGPACSSGRRSSPTTSRADEGTIDFCLRMMDEAEVALAPGRAFGENGEGYVRIALVENEQRLRQAMRNLERRDAKKAQTQARKGQRQRTPERADFPARPTTGKLKESLPVFVAV